MLHPAVKLLERSTIEGKGLSAGWQIPHDSIIWQPDDEETIICWSETKEWPKEKQDEFRKYAIQISEDEFVLCKPIVCYMNHSCDPNTWWADSRTLVACKDIEAGEEITYDYSTSDTLIDYQMPCNCGSKFCRGIISNKDHLSPTWQKKYGNHLPDHLLKAIAKAVKEKIHDVPSHN